MWTSLIDLYILCVKTNVQMDAMPTQQFQVVMLGLEEDAHAAAAVRSAMVQELGFSTQFVDHLVTHHPAVVIQRIDAETAIRYKCLIDAAGGISRIEPLSPTNNLAGTPGFVERRKADRRQQSDRRKSVRLVTYQNDRRQGRGRRASDY